MKDPSCPKLISHNTHSLIIGEHKLHSDSKFCLFMIEGKHFFPTQIFLPLRYLFHYDVLILNETLKFYHKDSKTSFKSPIENTSISYHKGLSNKIYC